MRRVKSDMLKFIRYDVTPNATNPITPANKSLGLFSITPCAYNRNHRTPIRTGQKCTWDIERFMVSFLNAKYPRLDKKQSSEQKTESLKKE